MNGLSGILLHVNMVDLHVFELPADLYGESTTYANRPFVLGDLVALREVGVTVVLAVEGAAAVDAAVERQSQADGGAHLLLVQPRQGARIAEADGADVEIGFPSEGILVAAEGLTGGTELDVRFEPDGDFV